MSLLYVGYLTQNDQITIAVYSIHQRQSQRLFFVYHQHYVFTTILFK